MRAGTGAPVFASRRSISSKGPPQTSPPIERMTAAGNLYGEAVDAITHGRVSPVSLR